MKKSIFDNKLTVYEAKKTSERNSDYYLFHGKGTIYYTVVRVSSHKPYSMYYSYRTFFPFKYQKTETFSKDVGDYLYGLSWDVLSYEEYFFLQMMLHEGMGIYVLGGKKRFGARWRPKGPLDFYVKDEYMNINYPANEILTKFLRKMISNGLLGHHIKKEKLHLIVSQAAKIMIKETREIYNSLWLKDRQVYEWQDIKPTYEIDNTAITKSWVPPQVYFSSHGMNKLGDINAITVEPKQNITSMIIDVPQKNNALEIFDMMHRMKIYRRKEQVIYQIIKKDIGIVSEMEYSIDKKVIEAFFNSLIHEVKIDGWKPILTHKEGCSIIKVRHSDRCMSKFEIGMQNDIDLLNLKDKILGLVDSDLLAMVF